MSFNLFVRLNKIAEGARTTPWFAKMVLFVLLSYWEILQGFINIYFSAKQ